MAKDRNSIVFEADLVGKGAPQHLSISIRMPYAKKTGEWACPVSVKGIEQDVASQECVGVLCASCASNKDGYVSYGHSLDLSRFGHFTYLDPVTTPPELVSGDEPMYSRSRMLKREEGTATVSLVIHEQGRPVNIHVEQASFSSFGAHAAYAIRGWKFRPATREGQPVSVRASVDFTYRLL